MGADKLIGVEYDAERLKIAQDLHLADYVFQSNEETLGKILSVTGGKGAEKAVDCSANDQAGSSQFAQRKAMEKLHLLERETPAPSSPPLTSYTARKRFTAVG